MAAAVLMVALSASVEAGQCRPRQINGNWSVYLAYGSGTWTECRVTVRNGRVLTGQCRQQGIGRFPVAGTLSVSRSCAISGQITATGCCFNQVIFGTLQGNGQAGAGIITTRPGVLINELGSHFTLVRRP